MEENVLALTIETSYLRYGAWVDQKFKKQKVEFHHIIKNHVDETEKNIELQKQLVFIAKLQALPIEEQFHYVNKHRDEFGWFGFQYDHDGLHTIYVNEEPQTSTPDDCRLKSDAAIQETEKHFMRLTEKHSGYEQILSVEDMRYWLSVDFAGFAKVDDIRTIKIRKESLDKNTFGIVRRHVYNYWAKYCAGNYKGSHEAYCKMLINRFGLNTSLKSMKSHFAHEVKMPSYLIK